MGSRPIAGLRRRIGAFASAPWLRAPLLLPRFPALLLAVGGAVAILGAATAAGPLFLSSAANETLQEQLAQACPWATGLHARQPVPLAGRLGTFDPATGQVTELLPATQFFMNLDGRMRAMAQGDPRLLPTQVQVLGSSVTATNPKGGVTIASVRPFYRDDALAHLHVLAGGGADGVWIPDRAARQLHVAAGDTIQLTSTRKPIPVRVAAVYRDPASGPLARYWCGQQSLLYPLSAFSNFPPPPLFMGTRPFMLDLERRLGERGAVATWDFQARQQGLGDVAALLTDVKNEFTRAQTALSALIAK